MTKINYVPIKDKKLWTKEGKDICRLPRQDDTHTAHVTNTYLKKDILCSENSVCGIDLFEKVAFKQYYIFRKPFFVSKLLQKKTRTKQSHINNKKNLQIRHIDKN